MVVLAHVDGRGDVAEAREDVGDAHAGAGKLSAAGVAQDGVRWPWGVPELVREGQGEGDQQGGCQ